MAEHGLQDCHKTNVARCQGGQVWKTLNDVQVRAQRVSIGRSGQRAPSLGRSRDSTVAAGS